MGIDKLVGSRVSPTKHIAVQCKGGSGVGVGSVSRNHCGKEVDIGGTETVEYEASVREVGESENTESDKLEGIELSLGVAEGDKKGLELLQMVEMIAFCKFCQDVFLLVQTLCLFWDGVHSLGPNFWDREHVLVGSDSVSVLGRRA